ncbi:MAG TPA: methyltransferase domain-containing protein, partial [Candidatus Dormibacteraeota bacterium]|nr:methyltransferase domain-containing protein [Candidatus Dormibacteraeota bacterium]
MMPELEKIYDHRFFEEWGVRNRPYVETARYLTALLYRQFQPKRLIDLGCGAGVYAAAFRTHGVEVVAVDGVVAPPECSIAGPVEIRDLTVPFKNPWGPFDLALCLEVAEHIPESLAPAFLETITGFSDTLILSCAPPFQRGHHHVNEQPKRYWIERLAPLGFAYDRKTTGLISETFKADRPPLMWMCQ